MRILLYSPDSYGLGHIRRSISIAKMSLNHFSDSSVLVMTGAPRPHLFDYPPRCDYVKLPSVTKNDEGQYVPRNLDMTLEQAIRLRGSLIREAANSFDPRVFMVDHSPLGLCGEILPTLQSLGGNTVRVLGMRDVIDEPEAVKKAWKRDDVIDVIRRGYDHVVVYGQRELFDPIKAYDIPEDVAEKMSFVGYLPRNGRHADPAELKRRFAPRTGKLVAVTLGGGGDGNQLLRSFLEGFEALGKKPPFEVAAVTGPLMSPRKRQRFHRWAEEVPGLTLVDYMTELPDLLAASDFAVCMGGYNTTCELACAGARALIVPRTFPRREQWVRAQLLEERGVVRCLEPERATPDTLMDEVLQGFDRPRPERGWGLKFTALQTTAGVIESLVQGDDPTDNSNVISGIGKPASVKENAL